MVYLITRRYYFIVCDKCGKSAEVEKADYITNFGYAVRFIGWSYGKDEKVLCLDCRKFNKLDRYKNKK